MIYDESKHLPSKFVKQSEKLWINLQWLSILVHLEPPQKVCVPIAKGYNIKKSVILRQYWMNQSASSSSTFTTQQASFCSGLTKPQETELKHVYIYTWPYPEVKVLCKEERRKVFIWCVSSVSFHMCSCLQLLSSLGHMWDFVDACFISWVNEHFSNQNKCISVSMITP